MAIKKSYGLDFVIPNLDAELPLFIKNAEALSEQGIGTFLPDMGQFRLRGKDRLDTLAKAIGVRLPRTRVVNSYDQFVAALGEIGFPAMVKGIFYKAYRTFKLDYAVAKYNEIVAEWGYPVIVQEVVYGDELNVVGLGDGEGGHLGLVCIKKICTTSLGKIWTGVTINNEQMLAAASEFVRKYRWRGPFELECICSVEDIWLIEVNPRFPAWVYFATGVGINLPGRMLKLCMGQTDHNNIPNSNDIPGPYPMKYESGKLFVRYTSELVTDLSPWQTVITSGETK